ncbi:alpha/beta hydrolase [Salibacterium sp. K-3]
MGQDKLKIWGTQIPYNTGENKFDELVIRKKRPRMLRVFHCMRKMKSSRFTKQHHYIHEMTYHEEISKGEGMETYDDVPYLLPFVVPDSDRAVVIVPGGGYIYKSSGHEGEGMARALNEAGISAFVLWYRLNPYKEPVPYADLQRALRYVRYYATEYGIDPGKVGVLGFSAGGHCAASILTKHRNMQVDDGKYVKDAVDEVDDRPDLAGLIYPVLSCRDIPNMLIALCPGKQLGGKQEREKLLNAHSLSRYVRAGDPPQFLCYGTKDMLIQPESVRRYKRTLDQYGVPNQMLELKGAPHGFGDCGGLRGGEKKIGKAAYAHWKQAFTDWANEMFDAK